MKTTHIRILALIFIVIFALACVSAVHNLSGQASGVPASILFPYGANPAAAAYDPGKNEVFVANSESSSVSVISDCDNAKIATIP